MLVYQSLVCRNLTLIFMNSPRLGQNSCPKKISCALKRGWGNPLYMEFFAEKIKEHLQENEDQSLTHRIEFH